MINTDIRQAFFTSFATELATLGEANKHYTLLNIWATWCSPCLAELPQLNDLSKELNINLVLIDLDFFANTAQHFLSKHKIEAMNFHDPARRFLDSVNLQGVPTSLLIEHNSVDNSAKVIQVFEGYKSDTISRIRQTLTTLNAD